MKITMLTLLLLASTSVFAQQQLANHDLVLVPVFFFGDGAHGSQWETDVAVASTSTEQGSMPVPLFADPFAMPCGELDGAIEGWMTRHVCRGFASASGLLMYVPKTLDAHDVHIGARIRDLSRQAQSAGTEIPVVREGDFRTREFFLLDIPADPRFRANLRIYAGIDTYTPDYRFVSPLGGVSLEIFDAENLFTPLVSTSVDLAPAEAIEGTSYLVHPAYASIGDLVAQYPQLAGVEKYTIKIVPSQSLADPPHETSYWAFVTITNNDTQEVTTVSP